MEQPLFLKILLEAGFTNLIYHLDKGFNNFYDCSHVLFSECCDMFEETCA